MNKILKLVSLFLSVYNAIFMPANEIIAEFFKGCESAAHIHFQFWDIFYLSIFSDDMDGMDHIGRANVAYTFQNI